MIRELPEKLKKLRISHGLSQKQVAERLDLSPSIVSGYETGERTPSTEVLLSLSYLYNVSTDYLLGRNTDASHTILNTNGLTDPQLQALQAFINTLK